MDIHHELVNDNDEIGVMFVPKQIVQTITNEFNINDMNEYDTFNNEYNTFNNEYNTFIELTH